MSRAGAASACRRNGRSRRGSPRSASPSVRPSVRCRRSSLLFDLPEDGGFPATARSIRSCSMRCQHPFKKSISRTCWPILRSVPAPGLPATAASHCRKTHCPDVRGTPALPVQCRPLVFMLAKYDHLVVFPIRPCWQIIVRASARPAPKMIRAMPASCWTASITAGRRDRCPQASTLRRSALMDGSSRNAPENYCKIRIPPYNHRG